LANLMELAEIVRKTFNHRLKNSCSQWKCSTWYIC